MQDICPRIDNGCHIDTIFIQRYMRERNVISLIDSREAQIPWVLNTITEIAPQQLHEPVVKHLGTSPHNNAFGINFHATKPAKMVGDSFAQAKCTSKPRFAHQHTFRFTGQGIPHRFRPCRIGEHAQRHR